MRPLLLLVLLAVPAAAELPLQHACGKGDVAEIRKRVEKGEDPMKIAYPLGSCFTEAAEDGNLPVVEMLIARKVDVNKVEGYGPTALMEAAKGGHADVVRALLAAGADPNIAMPQGPWEGDTALLHVRGAESAKLLLDGGARMTPSKDLRSPYYYAILHCEPSVVKLFLERGANVNERSGNGNYSPVAGMLSNMGMYVNEPKKVERCRETLDLLLASGLDVNDSKDVHPIAKEACYSKHTPIDFLKTLLAAGADPNAGGVPALYYAIDNDNLACLTPLLAAGADPDKATQYVVSARAKLKEKTGGNIDDYYPFSMKVNRYVQAKLDPWLKKDEFESVADYNLRMKGKKQKVGELMGEAFGQFGAWKGITVGVYDAESETFKLSSPVLGDMLVPVPKARARAFKEKFTSFAFAPTFVPAGTDGWKMSRLTMSGEGETFVYDVSKQVAYKPTVFDVKSGAAVDTALAGQKEIKSEVKKVTVAPADDVSRLPAFASAARPDDIAVVIGIENYRSLPRSAFSKGDAQLVKRYVSALGFAERNTVLLTDERATSTDLKKTLETWLKNVVKPGSRVLVYYSGHGAPDPASGKGYLVPYDGDPEYLADTAYSLERLVSVLNALPARESVVLLDSCFSGMGGRSVLAKNARPLVAKTAGPALGDNVALMTATGSDQISTSSEELGHGVFTYHLLKALKDGKKDLGSVYEALRPRVEDEARRQNARQVPTLSPGMEKARRFRLVD